MCSRQRAAQIHTGSHRRVNGALGIRIDDEVGGTTIVSLVVEDGRITQIFAMRNPDKLARLDQVAELSR